jgi:peptide deformylase
MPSEEVTDFGVEFQDQVDGLIRTLHAHAIAVGLAAPQVGIQKRLAVINLKGDPPSETLILVNPVIISESGKKEKMKESCMSLPHFRGKVQRRNKVAVKFRDRNGIPQQLEATGFLARVISHEVDHLDGIMYIDRMEEDQALEPVDFFK